jgi:DNA (cytosine-5)-methyltransferase 1
MARPKAIDLFAGAGGLALGLSRAGFEICAAVEYDKWAAETYRINLHDHLIEKDIREVGVRELLKAAGLKKGECDLLAGGPPCQGFSIQRRGPDEDSRNELVLEFLRLVEGIQPRFFLMENVSGLMSKRGRPFVQEFVRRITANGYRVQTETLDAVEFGVPQFRRRVILVGERADTFQNFHFPKGVLEPSEYRTVKTAIGDLPSPPLNGKPHIKISNHSREAKLSKLNLERLRHMPPGGGREDLPEHLQLPCHRNNPGHRHMEVYGRLAWGRPSGTITARFDSFTRGRFGHPTENRSLTLREGARLQTFPDSFVFVGNREEGAKQIGNAVPPLFAEVLGRAILRALRTSKKHEAVVRRFPDIQMTLTI